MSRMWGFSPGYFPGELLFTNFGMRGNPTVKRTGYTDKVASEFISYLASRGSLKP